MARNRTRRRVTAEERSEIIRLSKQGYSWREIARRLDRAHVQVHEIAVRPVTAASAQRFWRLAGPGRALSLAEREQILVGLAAGETYTAIAARLGRAVSTISREVNANGGRVRYRAVGAHQRAFAVSRRPKTMLLADRPALAAQVSAWLTLLWSPEKIACRLRLEFPDDPMMRVSHETIYRSLFVQGRGELRRELHRCLRSGRAARRPQHRIERRGRIPNMVMISERPAEVADRAVPGHWEGDLVIGRNGASQIGTLVERSTRYLLLLQLADGRAETVAEAMQAAIGRLPAELVKSITWDQGSEMASHAQFTIATGVQIYFCDPHSPWQRGSNEQTNGLLRDFMPKGYDLSPLSQDNLDYFAWMLNTRPRETLGYLTPLEKLAEFLATTA